MAIKYGVNADKILVDVPKTLAEQGEKGGKVRCLYDTYELTAALSQNDIIYMGPKLPSGARIVDVHLFFDDLDGGGGTLDVGWLASAELNSSGTAVEAVDADGFMADVDVATAAGAQSMVGDQPTAAGVFKKFSAEVQPTITADHSGGLDATSGTISLMILYVVE